MSHMRRMISIRMLRVFLLLSAALAGCRQQVVSKEKLLRIIDQDKLLSQARVVNGIRIRMSYVPCQLMVLRDLESSKSPDSARLHQLEKKYSPQFYFRLTFSKNNNEVIREVGSFHQYSDMLQVLSFEMGGHINATTDAGDTVFLKDYVFAQDYGMSRENESLLVFARKDFDKSSEIQVNLGEFGLGTGSQKFVFSKAEMEHLPLLKYPELN